MLLLMPLLLLLLMPLLLLLLLLLHKLLLGPQHGSCQVLSEEPIQVELPQQLLAVAVAHPQVAAHKRSPGSTIPTLQLNISGSGKPRAYFACIPARFQLYSTPCTTCHS